MKKIFTLLSAVLFSATTFAQAYGAPESIEFDYAHNRWLISNPTYSNILSRDSQTGVVTVFATGASGPQGLEIVNDTLYSCEGGNIHLYNINTGASIATIAFAGATFLNGITHDINGTLYITDFSQKKIHRLNTATRQHNIFVTGLVKSPDGIIYDQPNNRCVFVNWGASAPIMRVNLTDSTTATITATTLGNCDGIAKDGAGNYYVTSWTGSSITRFSNTFTNPTTVISTGLNNPADIFYNTVTDTLAVPNSGGNNTKYYYFGSSIGINEITNSTFNLTVSPNPVGERTEINYELNADGKVSIQLFDIKGQVVKTIAEENQSTGKHTIMLDKSGIAGGNYLLKLNNNNREETKKVIVNKQ